MTDRQLLQQFARALAATLSFALLFATGVAYSEADQPRTVDVRHHR